MDDSVPPTAPEQIRQLNRDLMEEVLDKAASDPKWKQRLLDEPETAIIEAGFPEAERLQEMQESVRAQDSEVAGQWLQMQDQGQAMNCQPGCVSLVTDVMQQSTILR